MQFTSIVKNCTNVLIYAEWEFMKRWVKGILLHISMWECFMSLYFMSNKKYGTPNLKWYPHIETKELIRAGLRLLSFESPAYKAYPWLVSGNVDFWRFFTNSWRWTPKPFLPRVWFMLDTCFPSGSVEFWYMLGNGCLHNWLPINTLNAWAQVSCLGRRHTYHTSELAAVGSRPILCDSTGRRRLEAVPGLPWPSPCTFSLCCFAL